MNIQLNNTEEYIDRKHAGTLGQVLIRCNNVLWISAAKGVEMNGASADVKMEGWTDWFDGNDPFQQKTAGCACQTCRYIQVHSAVIYGIFIPIVAGSDVSRCFKIEGIWRNSLFILRQRLVGVIWKPARIVQNLSHSTGQAPILNRAGIIFAIARKLAMYSKELTAETSKLRPLSARETEDVVSLLLLDMPESTAWFNP